MEVKRISEDDLRAISDFECEEESMTDFLKNEAYKSDLKGEGNTYLLKDKGKILGYYTIKCNALRTEDEENKYNRYKVLPAVEIARLAVSYDCKNKGIGSILLAYIVSKILDLKEEVGIKYIFLFALPSAIDFYKKKNHAELRFLEFPENVQVFIGSDESGCKPLYIPISKEY